MPNIWCSLTSRLQLNERDRLGPTDWDVGLTLTYPNWAAFDNLGQRTDPITIPHYGSMEARTAAATARGNYAELAQSFLIRQQTPNPIAK